MSQANFEKYVSFDGSVNDGRRLGNQLFDFAAVVYVSGLTGRTLVWNRSKAFSQLEQTFELKGTIRSSDLCPCFVHGEDKGLSYDSRLEQLDKPGHESSDKKTIILKGFFQSWKYTRGIETKLRKYFQFKLDLKSFAEQYLHSRVPHNWTVAFVRVAMHVRRGDMVKQSSMDFGYSIPNASYFHGAMDHFVRNYGRVQFIVVSQDKDWCLENIVKQRNQTSDEVNVTFAFDNNAGQDMAIMAACDHVIMSTGTFGWWAGFLAKGSTVYFLEWPRKD